MAVQWEQIAFANKTASKTTAAWSKSIGSGGDYATWAAMIADMPDLIAHEVTVTIKAGTTLTETCELRNKNGLTSGAKITIQAEKYFPTSGVIPTADSATATTLRDAALATAALGNDYFNNCWILVVHGTGTDNGFVPITDYVDVTGDIVVASWPGTQPDNTSRYLIVGALVDGESTRETFGIGNNTCSILHYGIGFVNSLTYASCHYNSSISFYYCGFNKAARGAIRFYSCIDVQCRYCGIVENNTTSHASHGGLTVYSTSRIMVYRCGISDNNQRGIFASDGTFCLAQDNFGDNNGFWGVYVVRSAQAKMLALECSGSSGNHSDPGTAGTANADQASAY